MFLIKKRVMSFKRNFLFLCGFVFISVFFAYPVFAKDTKGLKFIDVNNPFINRIPISVPGFIPVENNESTAEIVKNGNEYLKYLLNFTSYFEISNENLELKDVVGSRINFDDFKKSGSELLISTGVYYNDSLLEMELRLFDVVKGELITGKRYKGRIKDYQKMLRRFASEIMGTLFNNNGLFESKIAFVSDDSGFKEIHTCDFDGSNIHKLTEDKSIAISPSWSYDNGWIAYTSYKRKIPEIFVKSLTNKPGYIISHGRLNISPSWVPGKFCLAAGLKLYRDSDIFIVSGKGEILETAVKGWGIDVSPHFSPDGKQMVFVSSRTGSPQIYIKDFESDKIKRITYEGNYNTTPSWSPLGDCIAYVGTTKEYGINIYTLKPDGSDLKMITIDSGDNEDPSWSPDGSLLVFSSTRNSGHKKIFVMTRSGDDQRQLIGNMAGNQSEPAWSH